MSVIIFQFFDFLTGVLIFLGRDPVYQTLNLTFAINMRKFGMIISWFPRPLKRCVVTSTLIPLSLNMI
jgi:hypothetical protein